MSAAHQHEHGSGHDGGGHDDGGHGGGHGGGHDGGHGGGDTTGLHGMLLFGTDPLYLSHLPMFGHPHNFQVILEVAFDADAEAVLRADRNDGGDGLYTFAPAEFPIAEPTRRCGRPNLDRGHHPPGSLSAGARP